MVAKLIVLYSDIKDPKKFDEYYSNVHIPLAKKIPGVRKIVVSKVKGVAVGKANYYQVVEVYFDDMESLKRAAESKEAKEATTDGLTLDPSITILVTEEE
jgi:uncharacterized protein (TIGR02118 family)